jgi:hypothetical protein
MKERKEAKGKLKTNLDMIRVAWISGILLVIWSIFENLFLSKLSMPVFVPSIISSGLSILFTYGFYELAKKYNNKFLKVSSCLMMILSVLSFFISLFVMGTLFGKMEVLRNQMIADAGILDINTITPEQTQALGTAMATNPNFMPLIITIISLLFIYLVFLVIFSILFGVGIMKLKDKVKYSKVAGVLTIVGASTVILFGLGLLVLLVAFVYLMIILYNESKK